MTENRTDKTQISFRVSEKVNNDLTELAEMVANLTDTKPNKTGIARTSIKYFIKHIDNDPGKYLEALAELNLEAKEVQAMVKDKDMEALVLGSYKDLSDGKAYNIVKERYGNRLPIVSDDIKYRILAIEILESDKKTMQDIKSRVTWPIKDRIRQAERENNQELVKILKVLLAATERNLDRVLVNMDLSTYKG